ncbi:TetR/AcrR family transcriptional regulator [Aurantimonas sp. HBX-1]|uniref:TetR/AcrR family transcriptional regulator n=1 Tax=Aurantimonas sp. HBX-1 TaxID=2906072 RepID=UPI001F351646|nr:TetR/AcrR family transcriptional regulator [Aurantimonas sp. HBX-1]UIJ71023.1 TetR/AcrR family transcriptional regulator [Aurantimonas sp. HBX-1]
MDLDLPVSPHASPAALPTAHDQRRMHVLAAARSCFSRWGFHGASMQQICAEAQMSPGALYRYFPSKEAIIEAIAEEERVDAAACVAALHGEGSLVDRITAVGMDYLRQTIDPDTGGLMVEIWSESIRNTALGQRFHEIEAEVRRAFEAALLRAQESGEIDPGIDIAVVLTVLFAIGDGLVMRLQIEDDADIETIEPYLRRLVRGLLGGP